jgi:hypothetical protein
MWALSVIPIKIFMGRLHNLLLSDKEFYFRSWDDDAVFKFVPGSGYYIKWPGRDLASVDPAKSNVLVDSLLQFKEISKEEFNNF